MTSIVDKIVALSIALDAQRLPHAFGGALALAFCTERARATIDIDVNVFVGQYKAAVVLWALPEAVVRTDADLAALARDGQIRLWWDQTPVDIFLDKTEFHVQAASRRRLHEFAGHQIPFLGCSDLAVFKAFYNRTMDWADIEAMIAIGSLDVDHTLGTLVRYLGEDDERVERLRSLVVLEG